jgi:hypothetical protein
MKDLGILCSSHSASEGSIRVPVLLRYIQGLLMAALALLTTSAHAQQQKVNYPHAALWTKSEVTQIFENNWGVGADVIFRSFNEFNEGHWFQSLHRFSFRPWVHRQFGSSLRVWLSPIAYFYTEEYLGKEEDLLREPYHEMRTTLQVLHHHKMMGEKFTHTFRHWMEARYRSPFDEDEFFAFFRYRIRYRLRYLILKDYYSEKGMLYTYVSNEVMVSYGSRIVSNMFSQNRIQVALGYRVHNSTRLELRYVHRYRSRPSGFEYDETNILMLGLFVDQFSSLFKKDVRPVRFFD